MDERIEKFKEFIGIVGRGEKRAKALSFDAAREAMGMILDGVADPEQRGAFLLACRIRGEDPVEMAGFVAAMQDRFTPLRSEASNLISIGHPYDGREDTFIMGAGATLLAAAAGAKVVLHSAGRVPSKHAPGVADVLQALGLPVHLGTSDAGGFLTAHGFVHVDTRQFMPSWNGQLEIREKIGLRLPFSSAEKLLDPCGCRNVMAGIAHGPYLAKMSGALQQLKVKRGLIVQGLEGSCDLSPQHATRAAEINGEALTEVTIDPKSLGIEPMLEVRAVGADPQVCAALTRDAFELKADERSRGAAEAIALNAAVILWSSGVSADVTSGLEKARATLKSGAAAEMLAALKH
ncbi:MAG TPA: hypothetical protein VEK08_07550 [Planctomycetota bacterium]|nr:hypothetical protein [Planctomycetota bacterium]